MSAYKAARKLKLTGSGRRHATVSVTLDVLQHLEGIGRDMEKHLGVKLTRTQVLQHLIALYRKDAT